MAYPSFIKSKELENVTNLILSSQIKKRLLVNTADPYVVGDQNLSVFPRRQFRKYLLVIPLRDRRKSFKLKTLLLL